MTRPRKQAMGAARACVAAILASLVAAAIAAPQAWALPRTFWGVVPQAVPTDDQFQRLKRGGVDSIRFSISWGQVEPTADGTFDWGSVDPLVAGAAKAGIETLPFLDGAPSWAVPSARVPGSTSRAPRTLPVRNGAQRAAWLGFVKQAILRYGPGGSFWSENTTIPYRPVRVWQLWNEENFKYFVTRPNPVDYGKLVNISYATIKRLDPGARIILGGLFARPKEARYKRGPRQAYFAAQFLNIMYRKFRGIKRKFNGIALHPYTRSWKYLGPEILEVRRMLKANHDAGKALWITELGWSSGHPTRKNLFAKGRQGQAKQLRKAFSMLRKKQRAWRIQRVYWFSVDDLKGSCNFCDGSGLFGAGFTPKPAWFSYVRFAGGRP